MPLQADGRIAAALDQPLAAKTKVVAGGAVFVCEGAECVSTQAPSRALTAVACKALAKEVGTQAITANAVCPGFVATHILDTIPEKVLGEMETRVPLKRLGQPEELANVYAFLASDEASYINGAVLEVSGGLSV